MVRELFYRLTGVSVLLLLTALPVHGQTGDGDSAVVGAMELDLFQDIPSVYSASKHEQAVTEAPAFVSIVTAEEIARYGYRNLSEILASLPGFYPTYDRAYHYLGARGFSRPGDYNTRLLLLVDGIRLNDAVYDGGSTGTEFLLDVDLIERVEVVRGPASSLYGSNALLGVINVITKRGRDLQGVEFSGDVGSQESYKARLSYGKRLAGGMEIILSGTYFESQGDKSPYYQEYDDPTTNDGVYEDNDDTRTYSVFGKLSYGSFLVEGAYAMRDKGMPTGAYGVVFNDDRNYVSDGEYFVSLSYEHAYPQGWEILARTYLAGYPYEGDYVWDWAEEEDEEPYLVVNRDEADARWWGVEAQGSRRLFDAHFLTLGAEYRDNYRQDQLNFDEEIYLDDRRSSKFGALFVQDEWQLTGGLIINAGLRYDYFEDYDGNFNPRVAVIYSPFERSTLKLLYGEAFRTPNVYEQYYQDGGESQKAAPLLEPETVRTFEVVWEQFLGRSLRGTVAGFYYNIEDLINLETDPEDELLVFANVDEVEAIGLEVELEGKWPGGIEGRLSYSYQDAEDKESGEGLTNSPNHLAKANLIFPIIRERLFAGAELQYTSGMKTKSGDETESSLLTNLTLFNYTLPDRLQISASVYNLFDEDIEHPTSEELLQDTILQDGRTFRLKATVTF